MIIYQNEFDINYIKETPLLKRRKGKQKNKKLYKNLVCAFDIEATNIDELEQAVMYIWQMQIEEYTIIGRTWNEWLDLLERISSVLDEEEYIVIYIHNASYEFQFIKGVYKFDSSEVFATESRRIAKFEMFNHFEFRCSYYLTNSSLDKFLKKMNVENKKLDYDYKKRRFSWTELTDDELQYCINDVKGLVQALKKKMELDEDNLYTIPLTSTGYPRRDCKISMRRYNRRQIQEQLPNYEVQQLLFEIFRGGNTHANRWYSKEIIEEVYSYDIKSSYPNVLINKEFPIKEFKKDFPSLYRIKQLDNRHLPYIMRVVLVNVKLRNKYWGFPYLSRNKCRNVKNGIYDNGRILECDFLETSICDIDFKIIIKEYDIEEVIIKDLYSSKYGKLPSPLIDTILKYFKNKSQYKHTGNDYEYAKSKELLNACYGMMVENPIKRNILYIDDGEEHFIESDELSDEEILEKHNKKAFLNYAWGVYCTAHARNDLENMIDYVLESSTDSNPCDILYCDTDSVKYFGNVDWTDYNEKIMKVSISNNAFAHDINGEVEILGVVEEDGKYQRFKTNGAKKYAYEDEKGLHITIAGVNKKIGADELANRGGLEALEDGFIFKKGGGTESKYNDEDLGLKEIKEGVVDITSNVFIKDSEYTLGSTYDYIDLLLNVKKLKYNDSYLPFIYEKGKKYGNTKKD